MSEFRVTSILYIGYLYSSSTLYTNTVQNKFIDKNIYLPNGMRIETKVSLAVLGPDDRLSSKGLLTATVAIQGPGL